MDSMFRGVYNGSVKHTPDLESVLDRAWSAGLRKIIITGTSLEESKAALALAETDGMFLCNFYSLLINFNLVLKY